jgi:hypothetical protein
MSSVPTIKLSGGVELEAMVAEAAYYKAEQRGFAPGFEMDDWLEAERELASVLVPERHAKRKTTPRAVKARKKAPPKS